MAECWKRLAGAWRTDYPAEAAEPASPQKAEARPQPEQMVERPVLELQTVPEAERRMVEAVRQKAEEPGRER